jgi:hypothetical protein
LQAAEAAGTEKKSESGTEAAVVPGLQRALVAAGIEEGHRFFASPPPPALPALTAAVEAFEVSGDVAELSDTLGIALRRFGP